MHFVWAVVSLSHVFISAVQRFFLLPASYVHLVMIVMKAPHKLMVRVCPVQSVMCVPQFGIRQGDCLSPLIFSLRASMFLWQLWSEGLLDVVHASIYVDDLMLVFPSEHELDVVHQGLDYMEHFPAVCGLLINHDSTKWIKRTCGKCGTAHV